MPDFKIDITVDGVPVSLSSHTHDHDSLTGLTDDDHTEYARLLGRSGGQILVGGTADDNVLTLQGNSGTANTSTNKSISLLVGNSGETEAVTVLNNGNVGIGTTPSVKLDVAGAITASGVITGNGSGLTTLNASNISSGTLADARFTNALLRDGSRTLTADWDIGDNRRVLADGVRARDGAGLRLEDDAGNLGVFVEDGGDVGIGTTSPEDKLHVKENSTVGVFRVENSNIAGYSSMDFYDSSAAQAGGFGYGNSNAATPFASKVYMYSSSKELYLSTNGGATPHLLINTSGNVGIGTTTPGGKLEVDQASATANIPTLHLRQADNSEEFIRFEATVGAGNAIDTAALGTYYGKIRVHVDGVGDKFIALYNT